MGRECGTMRGKRKRAHEILLCYVLVVNFMRGSCVARWIVTESSPTLTFWKLEAPCCTTGRVTSSWSPFWHR